VWKAVGGFDGRFKLGGDDTDFCLRAQDAGYSIGFEPDAIVHYRLRDGVSQIAKQHYGYGRGVERMVAKRIGAGLEAGDMRSRWRWLATEAAAQLASLPTMLGGRESRRICVERAAFLVGRFVELVHELITASVAGAARPRA
jgi:hypothetical protein